MNRLQKQLDVIKATPETKENVRTAVLLHKKKKFPMPQLVLMATLCCLLALFLYPRNPTSSLPLDSLHAVSYVTLDINPSMEFTLDEQDRVMEIYSYNKDAETILDKIEIKGKPIREAFEILWSLDQWNGYVEKGIVEVGIYSDDNEKALVLENELNAYLESAVAKGNYHCTHINEKVFEEAKQHHASMGKYRVIQEILTYTDQYTLEDLSRKSMKALYAILETYDASAIPEGCGKNQGQGQGKHHDMGNHS